MNKTKHTPGPWIYKKEGFKITVGNESTRHDYLKHDYTVAVIDDNSFQAEANARLIAAAPDLLEACYAISYSARADGSLPGTPETKTLVNKARLAIAKAKGK